MKRFAATLACALMLAAATPAVLHAQEPAYTCHGYLATAHTGDFDLSVCRGDDNEAIDEAISLTLRITGDTRYIEVVTVVYLP